MDKVIFAATVGIDGELLDVTMWNDETCEQIHWEADSFESLEEVIEDAEDLVMENLEEVGLELVDGLIIEFQVHQEFMGEDGEPSFDEKVIGTYRAEVEDGEEVDGISIGSVQLVQVA